MAVDTPLEKFGTFLRGFVGQAPVYRAGRQVGYFKAGPLGSASANADLCKGLFYVYKGEERGDPKTLYLLNSFGKQIPLTDYCLQQGIKPSWLTVAESAAVIEKPTGALVVPGVYNDGTPTVSNLPMILAGSAVGLGVLLLLLRR